MKSIIILLIISFTYTSFALTEINPEVSTSVPQNSSLNSEIEVAVQLNSINNGSQFLSLGTQSQFWGLKMGARILLPMNYTDQSQIYSAQVYTRADILKGVHNAYIEGSLGESLLSAEESSIYFGTLGVTAGYKHQITQQLNVGLAVGVDYSQHRIIDNDFKSYDGIVLYNRLAVTTGYKF